MLPPSLVFRVSSHRCELILNNRKKRRKALDTCDILCYMQGEKTLFSAGRGVPPGTTLAAPKSENRPPCSRAVIGCSAGAKPRAARGLFECHNCGKWTRGGEFTFGSGFLCWPCFRAK